MKFYRKITFPFVPAYYLVSWFRNKLYDLGIKTSTSYNFPVICVGNLSVGGTGKTPLVEYLINLLKNDYSIATLSRGYKRKTRGFILATKNASAISLGDEPFQFYNTFKETIRVAVDANRQRGIEKLRSFENPPEIILLDDAYQHRKVKAGLNILLTTYHNLYTTDFVLPIGNLREPRSGAKRADIIMVTKCPKGLSEFQKNSIINKIKPKKGQDVFFSSIAYSNKVISLRSTLKISDLKKFTLVTGIANPKPLVGFLKEKKLKFEHLYFKDHHEFSPKDIRELDKKNLIITTEKDFMRLKPFEPLKDKLFYLPIKVNIHNDLKFSHIIKDFVK